MIAQNTKEEAICSFWSGGHVRKSYRGEVTLKQDPKGFVEFHLGSRRQGVGQGPA